MGLSITGLIVFFLLFLVLNLHKNTVDRFGPPADSLSFIEKIYRSTMLLTQSSNLVTPKNPYNNEEVLFKIDFGESVSSISQRLEEVGLIEDSSSFQNYLIYRGLDKQIQAGSYILKPNSTAIEIAWEIQDLTSGLIQFSILAGWRSEEIAAALPYSGLEIDPEIFLSFVNNDSLEGYLYPSIYTLPRNISPESFVTTLVDAFFSNLSEEIKAGFNTQMLSVHEAVILASIIEREAVIEDEMPLMASVFLNRLNSGMLLNADPTVQYALGYNQVQGTWWTNPLSRDDLAINSPYNTYIYPGLPPGPISNPGSNALKSVAFPAQTPYYYFRVSCDGSNRHVFSESFAEHLENACPE